MEGNPFRVKMKWPWPFFIIQISMLADVSITDPQKPTEY